MDRTYERIGPDRVSFDRPRVFIKMNLATGKRELYVEDDGGFPHIGTYDTPEACMRIVMALNAG